MGHIETADGRHYSWPDEPASEAQVVPNSWEPLGFVREHTEPRAVLIVMDTGTRWYCASAELDEDTGSITPSPDHIWEVIVP